MAGMSALLAVLLGWVRNEGGRVECRVCLFEQFWIETENEIMRKAAQSVSLHGRKEHIRNERALLIEAS